MVSTVPQLRRVDKIGMQNEGSSEVFLVASSFEPRSLRATELVKQGTFAHAVVFDYEDTLDTVMGRHHRQSIRNSLSSGKADRVDVLPCNYADPFSMVRALNAFLGEGGFGFDLDAVTIVESGSDARTLAKGSSCFGVVPTAFAICRCLTDPRA